MYISTRETLVLKIELASKVIKEENARRYYHNSQREKLLKKGKSAPEALPILKPAFVHTARKTPKRMAMGTKGMDTIVASSKVLRGRLSQLCNVLRGIGMKYPWRVQEEG
jgi:hypothetical protein